MAFNFTLFALYIFTLSFTLSPVAARPWAARLGNNPRSALVDRSTFTTTTTVTDNTGTTFIRTCTITLTPIVVNGQTNFVEVSSCTEVPINGGSISTLGTTTTVTTTTTSTAPSSSKTPAAMTPTAATTPTLVGAFSSIAVPNSSTSTSTPLGATTTTTSTSSATASIAESSKAPSSAAAVPGKTLSVLPIGLGVFAGVSVIALAVVGWVTYERTKYRKNFRARKQAEMLMGNGFTASQI